MTGLGDPHARVGVVVRVVIGDPAAVGREALAALLDRHGVQVPACAGSVPELARALADTRPDLALVDARLPPEDRPALAALRTRHPGVGLLVLADRPRVELARTLLGSGVAGLGFLVRDRVADVPALLEALRLVAAGGSAVDPEVVARLLTPDTGPLAALSARELDVLALLAEGRTNAGIAARLWLTPRTVEGHVRSIFAKLRLPVSATDHRRVLAARAYLGAQSQG